MGAEAGWRGCVWVGGGGGGGGGGEECVTSGPVHTMSKEFENRAFTLKTHQMFFVHTKNATITGHFGFVCEENSVRKFT